jgi:hypothetical protein
VLNRLNRSELFPLALIKMARISSAVDSRKLLTQSNHPRKQPIGEFEKFAVERFKLNYSAQR